MRLGYTAAQIRAAEAPHLSAGEPLMHRAAAAMADVIAHELVAGGEDAGRVLLLIGSGNNGGDALYAGARLAAAGHDVVALAVGTAMHAEGRVAARAAGVRLIEDVAADDLADTARVEARSADVIVDGILGTGTSAHAALREPARSVVEVLRPVVGRRDDDRLNGVRPRGGRGPVVVAVDIPSGIDPNDGTVPDATVLRADITVTFGGYKAGLLCDPAAALAGDVRLIDIGLGEDLARMTPAVVLPDRAR